MDEFLDIVDKQGVSLGYRALKSEAHTKGLYHNTIHLWLYTPEGKILLQQRSHKKAIYPLLWDVSVAGHIDAGESFIQAALRETKEEIGLELTVNALEKVGTFLHESRYAEGRIQDNEFHQVFKAQLKVPIAHLVIQESEVEAIKLVSIAEFKMLLDHSAENGHFIPGNRDYYLTVIEAISTTLELPEE